MATETGGRFVNISNEEVNQFREQQENENTKKKKGRQRRYSFVLLFLKCFGILLPLFAWQFFIKTQFN